MNFYRSNDRVDQETVLWDQEQSTKPDPNSPTANCSRCGKLFQKTASDIRERKYQCKNCRNSMQAERHKKLVSDRINERRVLVSRLDNMRYELIQLRNLLSKSPAEIRAAYLMEKDSAKAVVRAIKERDELFERVKQLEGSFRGDEWIPDEWELTSKESQFLAALVKRSPAPKDYVYTVIYGTDPNGGPDPRILDVMIHKIRTKLSPHNIIIETNWGIGYKLSCESLKKCRSMKNKYAIPR
jgi:hypothetical protein